MQKTPKTSPMAPSEPGAAGYTLGDSGSVAETTVMIHALQPVNTSSRAFSATTPEVSWKPKDIVMIWTILWPIYVGLSVPSVNIKWYSSGQGISAWSWVIAVLDIRWYLSGLQTSTWSGVAALVVSASESLGPLLEPTGFCQVYAESPPAWALLCSQ